jgi:hypothetical protein
VVGQEISRFPGKELADMPGSLTTQSQLGTHGNAPDRIAFRYADSVGTLDN